MNDIRKPSLRKVDGRWEAYVSVKWFDRYEHALAYLTGVPIGAPVCQIEQAEYPNKTSWRAYPYEVV